MDFRDYDTRSAAYALIIDDRERVLLALWNEGAEPQWTLPGGGVEFEETVEEAAVRELREETGYDVQLGRVLGVDSHVVPAASRLDGSSRPMKSFRVVFDAHITGGELTEEIDGTTDEARWLPLSDVPTLPRVPLVDVALGFLTSTQAP